MKTEEQLRVEIYDRSEAIRHLVERLGELRADQKESNRELNTLQAKQREIYRLEMVRRDRRAYRACKQLRDTYDIKVEIDGDPGEHTYWISQPSWLKGEDPIEDGHFAHCWAEALPILELYARHDPKHPEHDRREFHWTASHI